MRPRDAAELVALAALWGGSFLFMRMAVPQFGPVALIAVRVSVAALVLLVVLVMRGQVRALADRVGAVAVVGVANSALPFCLLAYSTLHLGAGEAAILNATAPLWTLVVGRVCFGTRGSIGRWIGLVLGFTGVIVLFAGRLSGSWSDQGPAIVAGLAAGLSYACAAHYSKHRLASMPPLVIATGSQIAAALCLLPWCAWAWPAHAVTANAWAAVATLGIACTALAYVLYFRLIANVGASQAITVTFLVPMFALVWGRLVLGEPVTARTLAGCALVLLGTAACTDALGPVRQWWHARRQAA